MSNQQSPIAFHLASAVCLLGLCLAVFGQVRQFEFVGYDDPIYTGNWPTSRVVGDGLSAAGLAWIWTASAASLWEPLNYLSHMIDVELWGNDAKSAGGHHLTNLALHCLNGLLVYWLLFQLAGKRWVALMAAAFFAIHPLRAESVAWVSERKGILCATFVLLALISYLRYVRLSSRTWFIASVLLTGLGMMTKPVAVVVPLLICLMDVWPLSRCGFEEDRGKWLQIVVCQLKEKWLHFAMAIALAFVSILIQYGAQQEKFIGALSLSQRLWYAPAGLLFYWQRTFWPDQLTIEYPYPGSQLSVYGSAFALFALAVWFVLKRKEYWPLLFGCLWFIVCWGPVCGLAYVGASFTTDRYTYLPHIGLFFGIAYQASCWLGDDPVLNRIGVGVAALLMLVCIPLTREQTSTWQNDLTLFQQTIVASPEVATGYTNLAVALEKRGRPQEAIPLLEKANSLQATYTGYYNLARLYGRDPKRIKRALQMYQKSLEINPEYAAAWHNLGLLELRIGRKDAALAHVTKACQLLDPPSSLYLNTLAEVHLHREEFAAARAVCERAILLPIDRPEVKKSLQEKLQRLSKIAD
jgi:hypothetical protein